MIKSNRFKSYSPIDEFTFTYNITTFNTLLFDKSIESTSLEHNAFRDFTRLTEVNLAKNRLKSLHPKLFQDLTNVTKIDLSYNQLHSIDPRIFKGLNNLTHIWLNNNQLSSINTKLFKGLNNLTHIWLNDNNWISDNLELYIESGLEFISFKRGINDINYEEVVTPSNSSNTVNISFLFIDIHSEC